MNPTKFIAKFILHDEEIKGYVDTDETVWYETNNGEFSRNTNISLEFANTHGFNNLVPVAVEHQDDTHFIYKYDSVIIIINPNDDFLDTLVYESDVSYVEDFKCNIRTSIESVIDSIIDNDLLCTRLNHNTIRCESGSAGWSFRVCFGDMEIADGFQSSMSRFFIKGDD